MDKIGSGIGRWTAEQERNDFERIMKNYKPRGTHTLGPLYGTKHGAKKTSSDK
jgi:hypothetical protein